MSAQPWHRRFHSDALAGMLSLTLEERGAYQTVLDLIYDRGGPIADNERLLAGYMNVSLRKWRTLRASLINKGKISADDGVLTNRRAEKEIENGVKTARKLAENGAKGGRKKAENAKNGNENSETGLAPLKQGSSLPQATTTVPLSNDNGPVAVDSDKVFWATAKAFIGGRNPGALIGKWSRDYSRREAAAAISAAQVERAVDPVSFIEATLRKSRSAAQAGDLW